MRILFFVILFSLSAQAKDCTKWMGPVHNKKLKEISGIAFSKRHPGVMYAHNDSGDKPRVFALKENGEDLGEFKIEGAKHSDWEDITVMNCPGELGTSCLAVGDIGNNRYKRELLTIYIVKEPKQLDGLKGRVLKLYKKIEFKLDTKTQNFESLFSYKDEIFLISKMDGNAGQRYPGEEGKSIVYKLDQQKKRAITIARLDLLSTKEFYALNEQGESKMTVPNYYSWATASDLSSDGKKLFLLTYGTLFEFDLGSGGIQNPSFENYRLHKIPNQPQVEALAINKKGMFLVSEYQHQPIYRLGCQ